MSERQSENSSLPRLSWDIGTAYDFFESLDVLHNPDNYDLRASWAAGVRSRMPADERKLLEDMRYFLWVPMRWINSLPEPKDATTVLWSLRQIPPAERMQSLFKGCEGCEGDEQEFHHIFVAVAKRGTWDKQDIQAVRELLVKYHKDPDQIDRLIESLPAFLDWWKRPEDFGDLYLSALQAYYQVFFAEEEKRIGAYLQDALERAQRLAGQLPLAELLVELSQGVDLKDEMDTAELLLAPVYWSTPLILWDKISPQSTMILFGARPADAALIPGEVIPEGSLRVLKALADPTRLKILRYLRDERLTPAQLARRLRLRAPTVIHHLKTLRLAGLVRVALDSDGNKLYAARLEAFDNTFANLGEFLQAESKEP